MPKKHDPSDFIAKAQGALKATPTHLGFIPWRCKALNLICGGGLSRGQIVEVYGPEGSGKSTMLYELLAIAAGKGFVPFLADQERCAFDERLAKFGLYRTTDSYIGNMLYGRGSHIEDLFDEVDEALSKIPVSIPVVVGIDSAGIMTCESDYNRADKGKGAQQGAVAKSWWTELRNWFAKTGDRDITIIILNHMTADFHNTSNRFQAHTTPGGKGIKHCAMTRIEVVPYSILKNEWDVPIGRALKVKTVKNKVAAPFQSCWVPLYFGNPSLSPEQDYVGTYDALASLWFLRDKFIVVNGKQVPLLVSSGSWTRFNTYNAKTGEVHFNIDGLPDGSWQGEYQWCANVFPEHTRAIYKLMDFAHYHESAWSGKVIAPA